MLTFLTILSFFLRLSNGDVTEKHGSGHVLSITDAGSQVSLEAAAASPAFGSRLRAEDDNLERLCNDPFHSFLCKPVTSRRYRIDGNLRPGAVIPSGIIPDASNLKLTSQPLGSIPSQKTRKSSSTLLQDESSQKVLESRYQRSNSTFSRKNSDGSTIIRAKYPMRNQENKNNLSKTTKGPRNDIGVNERFLELQESHLKKSQQKPSNRLSRKYLPVEETNVSPDSSNISPSVENLPLLGSSTKNREERKENHSLERICNDPFHSFLCKPRKQRRRIHGRIREGANIPPNGLVGASSFVREARVLPPDTASAPSSHRRRSSLNYVPPNTDKKPSVSDQKAYIPPDEQLGGYDYPKPSSSTQVTYGVPSTTAAPSTAEVLSNGYNYPKPSYPLKPPNPAASNDAENGYSYSKPTTYLPPITEIATSTNTQDSTSQPGGYTYLRPIESLALPTTQKPSDLYQITTGEPIATDKPSNEYLTPANNQTSGQGYNYQRPPNPLALPSETKEQESDKSSGYNYEKPVQQLTLPTTEKTDTETTSSPIAITTTEKPTTGYLYLKPTNNEENIASSAQSGYVYSKPSIDFTFPTSQQPQQTQPNIPTTPKPAIQTTSISITTDSSTESGYEYPKPSDNQVNVVSPTQTGYVYAKPSVSFTYPTTVTNSEELGDSSVTTTAPAEGYEYAKPTNLQETVSSNKDGYDYPKPDIPFPPADTPTTKKPLTFTTSEPELNPTTYLTTQSSTNGYNYSNSNSTGYTYDKPQNGFTLPTTKKSATGADETTTAPSTGYEYPNPSNVEQEIVPPTEQSGYNYPKPSTLYNNPTTYIPPTAATAQSSQTTQSLTATSANGYEYPKPSIDFTYPPPGSAAKPQNTYLSPGSEVKPQNIYLSPISATKPQNTYLSPESQAKPQNTYLSSGSQAKPQNAYLSPGSQAKPQNTYLSPGSQAKPQGTYFSPGSATKPQNTYLSPGSATKPQNTYVSPGSETKPQNTYLSPGSETKPQNTYLSPGSETKPQNTYLFPGSETKPQNTYLLPRPNQEQTVGTPSEGGYVYQRPNSPSTTEVAEGYHYPKPAQTLTVPSRRSARHYKEGNGRRNNHFRTQRNFQTHIYK